MTAGAAPPRARVSKRAAGRPRGSNTDVRREMIIAAAIRVFAYRGYDAASMQEVADLVDITRPAVHHHFPGKAPLFRAALERACATAMTREVVQPFAQFTPDQSELRVACALLGTSLAQSHRIAEIAPRITGVAADLRRLCAEAIGSTGDEQQLDLLVTVIVGRWVLIACDLSWADLDIDVDRL